MARVILEGVSKVFARGVRAVDGLDLEVNEQEFLVLVGPSGCGKSTTLRMIAGLERPTAGVIRIGERDVGGVAARDRNVAMVFQNQPLYPHFSVRKNIEFGLRQRNEGDWLASIWRRLARPGETAELAARRREMVVQVREAARSLGVEELLDRMPRQLSGGERQRVALGRAIVRNPAVFLLDEPLSNLDANLRVELRRLLRRLHDQKRTTTIHVTHDQAESLALADRVAVMDRGRIRQIGTPLDVYDRPQNRFVAGFIGSPPMNLVEGRVVRREGKWALVAPGFAIELENNAQTVTATAILERSTNQECALGIRAEHVQLVPAVSPAAGDDTGPMRIARVEELGDASWVYLEEVKSQGVEKYSESKLISKSQNRTSLRPGEIVAVRCEVSHAHWFDRRSGERLT